MARINAPLPLCGNAAKRVGTAIALAAVLGPPGIAVAADVQVLTSGAPAEAEKAIAAVFTAAIGHRVIFTVAPPATIADRIARGARPDVVVLPADTLTALDRFLQPGSRATLARVGVGVVVRQDAPPPDIATPDAVKKMLLDARAIVMSDPHAGGFAGAAVARMISGLGIAAAVEPKTTLRNAIAGGVALVASGEADVGLFNISEIIPVPGVALAGPLPPALQSYVTFATAVLGETDRAQPALAFVSAMLQPGARAQWTAAGLEPLSSIK